MGLTLELHLLLGSWVLELGTCRWQAYEYFSRLVGITGRGYSYWCLIGYRWGFYVRYL